MKNCSPTLLVSTLLTSIFVIANGFSNNCLGYEYTPGKLEIYNEVSNHDFIGGFHTTVHASGQEGFDSKDSGYDVFWDMDTKATKIVSIIPGYELMGDSRPLTSTSTIYLELSLHSQSGSAISVTDLKNELRLSFPLASDGYTFGSKPITLWQRNNPRFQGDFNLDGKVGLDDFAYFAADWNATDVNSIADISGPNGIPDRNVDFYDLKAFGDNYLKDSNDPDNYTISFIADIREVIAKNGSIVPLPNLNGEYGSQVPYMYAQTRFNTFPGDFNLDGKIDLKDYAYWANCDPIADITGANGLPDKNVDVYDLSLFKRDWLKDSNDPNTWRDFLYSYE
jgi:hypothetical protein